jgi:hypothetical protein
MSQSPEVQLTPHEYDLDHPLAENEPDGKQPNLVDSFLNL